MDNGIIEIDFPESCVLYIRNHRGMPDHHAARIRFADGQTVTYKVPVIMAQDYTVDSIFEKRLLALLPYRILRYEHFLKSNSKNSKKLERMLDDYRMICGKLQQMQEHEDASGLYVDIIGMINKLADYVIPDGNPAKERLGEIMGGQILKLRSEELIEEGDLKRAMKTASNMRKRGASLEEIAEILELPPETIRSWAKEAGLPV